MATTTTRLGLRKAAGSDTVNVTTDLDNNFDTLDAAVSTTYATTSTRPSVPFQGQAVYESDSGLLVVSNGSVPASGSWLYPKAVVNRVTQAGRPTTVANGVTVLETDSGALVVSNGSVPASGSWSYPRAVAGNVTSSTRPSVVTAGLQIRESDTHNMLVSNGSSPASGSWEHDSIPVVSSTASIVAPYTGQLIFNTTDSQLYEYNGSSWVTYASLSGVAVGGSRTVTQDGDQSVTNSTTLINSTYLTLPVVASGVYKFEAFIGFDANTTADAKFNILVPGVSPSMSLSMWGSASNATIINDSIFHDIFLGFGTNTGGVGAGTVMSIRPVGTIRVGNASGNVVFQFAQNTANATNATILKKDSWMTLTRTA